MYIWALASVRLFNLSLAYKYVLISSYNSSYKALYDMHLFITKAQWWRNVNVIIEKEYRMLELFCPYPIGEVILGKASWPQHLHTAIGGGIWGSSAWS